MSAQSGPKSLCYMTCWSCVPTCLSFDCMSVLYDPLVIWLYVCVKLPVAHVYWPVGHLIVCLYHDPFLVICEYVHYWEQRKYISVLIIHTVFCVAVHKLRSSKDSGQVEVIVGPYKLYDTSFRTLYGNGWLSDEVKVCLSFFIAYLIDLKCTDNCSLI